MSEKNPNLNVLKKLLEIQKNVGAIPKNGYDEMNDYHYFRAEDIVNGVAALLNRNSVLARAEIVEHTAREIFDGKGRERPRITGLVRVIYTDVDSGEEYADEIIATGSDIGGDKAPRKFDTQLWKIAFIHTFKITDTDRGIDSDDIRSEEEDAVDVPEKIAAPSVSEISNKIGEMTKDKDLPSLTAAAATEIGKAKFKEVHGRDPKATPPEWRNDSASMQHVLEKFEAVKAAKAAGSDIDPITGEVVEKAGE